MSRPSTSRQQADSQPFRKAFVEERTTDAILIGRDAVVERESASSKVLRSRRQKRKHRHSSYHPLTKRILRRNASLPNKYKLLPTSSPVSKPSHVPCHKPNKNCTLKIQASSQEVQNHPTFNFQNGSFSSSLVDAKKQKKIQREFKNPVSGKSAVVDNKRNLRPRCPPKLNKATLLKHLREVKICDADGERLVGRRIKVYWLLDMRWYYGTILSYDGCRKLHKIMYDDHQEEWLALEKERFKLQVSPGELFGQKNSVVQETKPIHGKKRSDSLQAKALMWVKDIAQGSIQSDVIVKGSQKHQIGEQREIFTQHETSGCAAYPSSFETKTHNPQGREINKSNMRSNVFEIKPKTGAPKTIHVYFRRRKKVHASNRFVKLHKNANFYLEGSCNSKIELAQRDMIDLAICNRQTVMDIMSLMDTDGCRVLNADNPVNQTRGMDMIVERFQESCKIEPSRTWFHRVMEGSADTMVLPLASPSLTEQNEEPMPLSPMETEEQTISDNDEFTDILEPSCRLLVKSDLQTPQEISLTRKCLAFIRIKVNRESLTSRIQPASGVIPACNLKKAFRFLVNILYAELMAHDLLGGRLFPLLSNMDTSISVYDIGEVIRELLLTTSEKRMQSFDWCSCRQIIHATNKLYWKKVNGGCSDVQQHSILAPTGINHVTFQQIVDVFVCSLFIPSIWASLSHSSTVTAASLQGFLKYNKGGHLEVASQWQRYPVKSIVLDSGSLSHLLERALQRAKLLENGSLSGNLFLNCGSKRIVPVMQQFEAKTAKPVMTDQTHKCRLSQASEVSEFAEPSYSIDIKLFYANIHAAVMGLEKLSEEETCALFENNPASSQADNDIGRALHLRKLFQKECHLSWKERLEIVAREVNLKFCEATDDDPNFNVGGRCIPFSFDKGVKTDMGGKRSFFQYIGSVSSDDNVEETCNIKRLKGVGTNHQIQKKWMEFEGESVEFADHQKHSRSNKSELPSVHVNAASKELKAPFNIVSNVVDIRLANLVQSQQYCFAIDAQSHDSCRSFFSRIEEKSLPEVFGQYGTFQLPVNTSNYLNVKENSIETGNQMNKELLQQKVPPVSKVGWKKRKMDTSNSDKYHGCSDPLVSTDGSLQSQSSARRGRPRKQKMISEELPSFCSANLLIIDYDRCWRELGATVELYLVNGVEWVISVKVPGGILYTHKVQSSSPTGTTNRYTRAMMWKGGNNWTLEFSERRQWSNFKRMYEECCQRNVRSAFLKHIPVPGVREIHDSSTDVECPKFTRPSMDYIHEIMGDTEAALAGSHVIYDMDSEDERWICSVNNDRAIAGAMDSNSKPWISENMFERIVDKLEKVSFKQQHEPISSDLAFDVCEGLGPVDIVKAVHIYWLSKRQAKGMALVRHFQPAPWEIYRKQLQDSHACNNQSRPQLPRVWIGPPLFAFCLRPRKLEIKNNSRMQKQKYRKKRSSEDGCAQHGASATVSDYSSKEFANSPDMSRQKHRIKKTRVKERWIRVASSEQQQMHGSRAVPTVPRLSLDPFTSAGQIEAKAAAARLVAARKHTEAQRRLLRFDHALKKAAAAVIELEASLLSSTKK